MQSRLFKDNRSPGRENLDAELFKADSGLAPYILQPLFTAISNEGKVPDDWIKGVIRKIPKKGTLTDCNSWRGITLMSVPSKILVKVIIKRILDVVDRTLRNKLASGKNEDVMITSSHSASSLNGAESGRDNCKRILLTLRRRSTVYIWTASGTSFIRHYGILSKLVQLITSFDNDFKCSAKGIATTSLTSRPVPDKAMMSAVMINLTIDWVMRRTREDAPRGAFRSSLDPILVFFADYLALLSHTQQQIQDKTMTMIYFSFPSL